MATDDTRSTGRLRRPLAALSRLSRLGDVPVVVMLAWAGWLAVPWSFSGLAQARAAAAAAADAETPQLQTPAADQPPVLPADGPYGLPPMADDPSGLPPATGRPASAAWGIPAARTAPFTTVRPWHPAPDTEAVLARERARIAGEVHDAAGHGLAAIAMQAGLALVTLDDDPEQARASLRAIKETSTTALAHLRAALDGIDPPAGDLAALIDGVRAAGLPVDVEPPALTVPPHLHGPVYRVVRESLTNVLRHAGPTRALVRVTESPGELVVEVADRGVGPTGEDTGTGEGRGMAGMRARVTEAGGRFTAGPREGGGFRVEARFPQVSA
ncbi:sensor histidine kinase [[Actinomadura] parvosata]|uniref:sensor histidine kinase n=1 Tax=[Actinomadura] parvosata TaxID=1955412 RepID=UPI00406C8B55